LSALLSGPSSHFSNPRTMPSRARASEMSSSSSNAAWREHSRVVSYRPSADFAPAPGGSASQIVQLAPRWGWSLAWSRFMVLGTGAPVVRAMFAPLTEMTDTKRVRSRTPFYPIDPAYALTCTRVIQGLWHRTETIHLTTWLRSSMLSVRLPNARETTSGLENRLPLLQLRVTHQASQGFVQGCNSRIDKPHSFLLVALCCTVLRSRWCQSGVTSPCIAHRKYFSSRSYATVPPPWRSSTETSGYTTGVPCARYPPRSVRRHPQRPQNQAVGLSALWVLRSGC
jgi:hypothetical protein